MIYSFILSLLAFTFIGALASIKAKKNTKDYLLAGSNVSPFMTALSAVATNNSGYMFVGMIGYTYQVGLSSVWLMVGWISGDFVASFFIHKKLRETTETTQALSFSSVLSRWGGHDFRWVKFFGGLLTLVFLSLYAAAQLKAGSKALHVLLGWNQMTGAIIGALIVTVYCFAGGIRASIWTDCAQSVVMIVSMAMVCVVSIHALGGLEQTLSQLKAVSPSYMNWFPSKHEGNFFGALLFVLGWVFAGFGVVGQPHIMVRFMALNNPTKMAQTRAYYYSWYLLFYALTIIVGLCTRLLLPEIINFDAELALPSVAIQLLPGALVGLVLAGLFAATMSTADSQIISCTAAISNDLMDKKGFSYWGIKILTLGIAAFALIIALFAHESVFSLVLIAWAALACSFAPLMLLLALDKKMPEAVALSTMLFGFLVVCLWRYFGLSSFIYEIFPGMLSGLLPYLIYRLYKATQKARC